MKRPRVGEFKSFNAYCRAMDEYMRWLWETVDYELTH